MDSWSADAWHAPQVVPPAVTASLTVWGALAPWQSSHWYLIEAAAGYLACSAMSDAEWHALQLVEFVVADTCATVVDASEWRGTAGYDSEWHFAHAKPTSPAPMLPLWSNW